MSDHKPFLARVKCMSVRQFEVDVLVTPSHNPYHGSSLLAGLSELAREKEIRLRIRGGQVFDPQHSGMVSLEARNTAGERRKVAIDLADRADYFSIPMLEDADVYFKRSFSREFVRGLPAAYHERIRPFGLNFASLGTRASGAHLRVAASLLLQRVRGSVATGALSAVREFLWDCRLLVMPSARAFEPRHEPRADDTVLLQTRVWPPEPSTDNLEIVNAERVALVQVLRRGLGQRFMGGIVADAFSRASCPAEVLVDANVNMRRYARLLGRGGIAVYVRGLHHSTAFKMAEYLAAGVCIVSEPIKHELPVPLVEGVNYRLFRTPEECLAQCLWLISHPHEAAQMRAANRAYYSRWVAPRACAANMLIRSFQ
jgi:hypothetical protein